MTSPVSFNPTEIAQCLKGRLPSSRKSVLGVRGLCTEPCASWPRTARQPTNCGGQARVLATAQVTILPDGTLLFDEERVRLTPL